MSMHRGKYKCGEDYSNIEYYKENTAIITKNRWISETYLLEKANQKWLYAMS